MPVTNMTFELVQLSYRIASIIVMQSYITDTHSNINYALMHNNEAPNTTGAWCDLISYICWSEQRKAVVINSHS